MSRKLPPLKKYRILTDILNQDKEIYTYYDSGNMHFKVNFDELVYTLKVNPDLYNRPIVELEDYGFMIRGNNVFFIAGVEAGIKSFICDVNINTLNDRHMSQFQLLDVIPKVKTYKIHNVYFIDVPGDDSMSPDKMLKIINRLNNSLNILELDQHISFSSNDLNVVELKIAHSVGDKDFTSVYKEVKALLANHCKIRSENGLVSRDN